MFTILAIIALLATAFTISFHPSRTTIGNALQGSRSAPETINEDSIRGLCFGLMRLAHENLSPYRRRIEGVLSTTVVLATVLSLPLLAPEVNYDLESTITEATAPAVELGTSLIEEEDDDAPTLVVDGEYDRSAIMSYAHQLAAEMDESRDYNERLSEAMKTAWAEAKGQR